MLKVLRASFVAALAALLVAISAGDAAAQACQGAIGDFVWLDQNQNGLRDPAESGLGINGVVLELRDSSGALVATKTTGAATGSIPGSYGFVLLCPGTYTVAIVSGVPAGYVPTVSPAGADPTRDSSASPVLVTLSADQKDASVDFGFVTGCSGSIGDRVWNDLNQDGIQDAGEPGLPGIEVRLSSDGSPIGSAMTDGHGNYGFQGLCPGNYTVEVVTPNGFANAPTLGTTDVGLDSDESGVVVSLGLNENNATIDFGLFASCDGTIGDRVWFDTNRNGVQDAGELGIAGVTLELVGQDGAVIATTVTSGTGDYRFTGLCPDNYTVRVVDATLPDGVAATPTAAGTPANDSNGSPAAVTVATTTSTDLTIDFGYFAPCTGTIGDRVWADSDADGIQDPGEIGFSNVRVILRDRATNAVLAVDMTDINGGYLFEGLCAGDYIVEVDSSTLPNISLLPSPANQGDDDEMDSDGVDDEAAVTLTDDDTSNQTVDFGYRKKLFVQSLQLLKLTNGTDNNLPTGPAVMVGSTVTWTYRVTNTGSTEPLRDVTINDDNGTPGSPADDFAPLFSGGDTNGNGLLEVGETWTFVATGAAIAGQYANLAVVTAIGNESNLPVTPAKDPDHYFGTQPPPPDDPKIKLVKSANKDIVVFGEPVTFTYVVTNIGNVTLTNVVVTDDNATPRFSGDDFTVGTVATLAPGASVVFSNTRIPPTKMCNRDWEGKQRKCGLMVVEHGGGQTTFRYFQSRDHRDDFDDQQGWSGKRSYSRKAKFRILDGSNLSSQETDGVEIDMQDDDEYDSRFETTAATSFVSSGNGWIAFPKVFHKNGWDSNWRSDWDSRGGDSSRWGRWDDDKWGHDNDRDYDYLKRPEPCTTTSTNIATVVAYYGSQSTTDTDKATVQIVAPAPQAPYKTFTQGGWGAKPSGNNPGRLLADKFASVYPDGFVRIGDTKWLKFTSAYAIQKFLPQGGTPARLYTSHTNPMSQLSVFAGQVLALQLNVDFSRLGFTRTGLGNLIVVSGELEGSTVAEVLALANSVLGGGALPSGLSLSELNSVVAKINENFDGGVQNNGYLTD